jgi:hypothetical protein
MVIRRIDCPGHQDCCQHEVPSAKHTDEVLRGEFFRVVDSDFEFSEQERAEPEGDAYRRYLSNNPVKSVLDKYHATFDQTNDANIWNVLITTPMTLASRHGPSSLIDWRIHIKHMGPNTVTKERIGAGQQLSYQTLVPSFPSRIRSSLLPGRFSWSLQRLAE